VASRVLALTVDSAEVTIDKGGDEPDEVHPATSAVCNFANPDLPGAASLALPTPPGGTTADPIANLTDSAGKLTFNDTVSFANTPSAWHGYRAVATDRAGNTSVGTLPVFVDTEVPGTLTKLNLLPESDTGVDDADDVTNDNTPTFMVSGAEENSVAVLWRCPGAAACSATNRQGPIAHRIGNGPITATKTADNVVGGNTSWRFTVQHLDAAGRAASLMATDLSVVIDTTPPAVPSAPELVPPSELTAASATKTGAITPTFRIASGSGRVELLRNGVVVANRTGAGLITDPGPVLSGTYSYTTRASDNAGNVSAQSAVTEVQVSNGGGYWLVGSDGGVFAFGDAGFFGSTGDRKLNAPVIAVVPTPTKAGYWLLSQDGGVFAFGDAGFFGSTGDMTLNSPIIGMASTRTGKGYWLFAADGGVFTFGDAPFHGSPASSNPTSPIVGMQPAPDGRGYWLVAKNGKVYSFGSAASIAGLENMTLNAPIVGMGAMGTGAGLWLVGADGGVFALGDAKFLGSTGGMKLNKPIIGMVGLPAGDGYYLYASDGGVFAFGNAPHHGSTGSLVLNKPIVGMAAS
jgi:hypothetical protein